jgi:hypothetical protein
VSRYGALLTVSTTATGPFPINAGRGILRPQFAILAGEGSSNVLVRVPVGSDKVARDRYCIT